MNRFRAAIALLLLTAGCSSPADEPPAQQQGQQQEGQQPPVADVSFFSGALVIPGDGSKPVENATMIVESGIIKQIGGVNELQAPHGSIRVDLAGYVISPQLINVHGNAGLYNGTSFSPRNYTRETVMADLNRYEYYGVSTVQLLGTDTGDVAFKIRDEQQKGMATGARVLTAGQGITARGGWPTPLLDGIPIEVGSAAEARKAVGDLADKKVDVITMWVDDNMGRVPKLSPELYGAIIDEAHKRNLKAVAQVFYLADAKGLADAGIDGLVHSIRDRDVDDALIATMKAKNIYLAPTLTAHESRFVYADKPGWLGEQTMREVYPAQLSSYLGDPMIMGKYKRNPDLAQLRQQFATAKRNLKKMADGGVKIVLGTGSGSSETFPGYFEHRELELMVDAGMSPVDVIKAATVTSAEVLGLADRGALLEGKRADFFVFPSSPLEDITTTKNIAVIYRDGHELDRAPLIKDMTMEIPRITDQDRAADRAAQAQQAEAARIAAMDHYGKYPLGKSATARGNAIPTPLGSTSTVKTGPPDTITVALRGAGAGDLNEFYAKALARYSWQPQGSNCYGKQNAVSKKTQVLCVQASSGSAVIQITER